MFRPNRLLLLLIIVGVFWGAVYVYVPALERVASADVIIVLGHPVNDDGSATPALREEVAVAVGLFEQRVAENIIVTGGAVRNQYGEAELMASMLAARGVPPSAIHIEDQAQDTIDNAQYSQQIMNAQGWDNAILVTTPYHVRRASVVFNTIGIEHTPFYDVNSDEFASSGQRLYSFAYEVAGFGWYVVSQLLDLEPFWSAG